MSAGIRLTLTYQNDRVRVKLNVSTACQQRSKMMEELVKRAKELKQELEESFPAEKQEDWDMTDLDAYLSDVYQLLEDFIREAK